MLSRGTYRASKFRIAESEVTSDTIVYFCGPKGK